MKIVPRMLPDSVLIALTSVGVGRVDFWCFLRKLESGMVLVLVWVGVLMRQGSGLAPLRGIDRYLLPALAGLGGYGRLKHRVFEKED